MNPALIELSLNLGIDAVLLAGLVGALHVRHRPTRPFLFTIVMLHVTTFGLTWLLSGADASTGLGLGLFAVFGLLRYRTESIDIDDLTWLFLAIGLAVTTGFQGSGVSRVEIVALDVTLLVVAALMAAFRGPRAHKPVSVVYDRVELVAPARRDELIADLERRLGLDVVAVVVGPVDLLKETVDLKVSTRTAP